MRRLVVAALLSAGACFLPELEQQKEEPPADPCQSCAGSECLESSLACFSDAGCAALVQCAFGCDDGDDACFTGCTQVEGAAQGIALAIPLAECTADACSDVCPAFPGFGAGAGGGPTGAGGSGGSGGSGN